jgi:GT2 family glycosyltransferase
VSSTVSHPFAAAILTWRNERLTRACLESLTRSSDWPFPVLIVDNASGTLEGSRIASEYGLPVEAVTLDTNGGVPAGYNAGLRWASSLGAGHVLLLNNDTILSDTSMIGALLARMRPDVAAAGPRILRPDGTTQSVGGQVLWRAGRSVHLTTPRSGADGLPYPVDWLDGSCLLVSLAAARRLGGLSDDFFLYWEDVDWGVRATRAGLRCEVQPAASILHLGSATVTSATQLRFWMRNKVLFMRRNAGLVDNATSVAALVFGTVPRYLVRQGPSPAGWIRVLASAAHALGWNLADAIRRRSWRIPAVGPPIT